MKKLLSVFIFIGIVSAAVSNDPKPKRLIRAFASDYHDTMVTIHWDDLAWCSGGIIAQNRNDIPNLSWSGIKIGGKRIRGRKLTLKSILNDDPYLRKYEDDIYECINMLEQPNKEMVALAEELKQQGVILVLASNMDEESLELNKSKLKPKLFGLFDIHFVANEQNGRKPDPLYYKNMLRRIREEGCKGDEECMQTSEVECVFTDDLKENVEGAEKTDSSITGFHFTKPSKAKKLRKKLIKRNFLKQLRYMTHQ